MTCFLSTIFFNFFKTTVDTVLKTDQNHVRMWFGFEHGFENGFEHGFGYGFEHGFEHGFGHGFEHGFED